MKNLTIQGKLIAAFAVMLTLIAGLGAFAIYEINAQANLVSKFKDTYLPAIATTNDMTINLSNLRRGEVIDVMTPLEKEMKNQEKKHGRYIKKMDAYLQELPQYLRTDEEKQQFADMQKHLMNYYETSSNTFKHSLAGDKDAARHNLMVTERQNFFDLGDKLKKLTNSAAARALVASQSSVEQARLSMYLVVGAILVAMAMAVAVLMALVKAIATPVVAMTNVMGALADGDLDTEVPVERRDDEIGKLAHAITGFKNQLAAAERAKAEQTEVIVSSIGKGLGALAKGDLTHRVMAQLNGPFAALKADFNAALDRLQETMRAVTASAGGINGNAGEIAQAADALSRRTEQQAASLEETAAALEEITATVKKTAANANNARQIVAVAKDAAEDGSRVVETATTAMSQIEQSSKQINDILGVIDEIAFQTNLLALNAGVEAARAGEAGKGFAVVASEVRALAQRSSEAAKEIKALIKNSGEQVEAGVRLVGQSGEALRQIAQQVVDINALVSEMAQAAEQQSSGVEEVNVAVGQMDQTTQQNAAMVEESTAASRNLANETEQLARIIAFFDVGGQVDAARATPKPAAKPEITPLRRTPPRKTGGGAALALAKAANEPDWEEF